MCRAWLLKAQARAPPTIAISAPEVPPFITQMEGRTSPFPHVILPAPSPTPSSRVPRLAVPGCGRPRAVAASRTMSPSRASKGGDCTTLRSEADWGRGTPQAAMCSLPRPPSGVSPPPTEQSTPHPPPSRNGVALPYLRPLTPEGKWTCPSAVCQLPGLCGKMDPPARRRVGSWCLTRPLLGVRLGPGRQENQHTERLVSSPPTHISTAMKRLAEDRGTPGSREWYRQDLPGPRARALPWHREATGPADRARAAASTFSHARSRPHLTPSAAEASRAAPPRVEVS